MGEAQSPQVAVNGDNDAVAVWSRFDGYAPLPSSSQAQFDILGEARKAAGKIAR